MPSLESITFDQTGFQIIEVEPGVKAWHTADGDVLSLHFFDIPPDIEADIDSINDLRVFTRGLAKSQFGIIELERIEIDDCRAIRQIIKIPQQPTGMTYLGSWTIPFRDFSYVVKISCEETGMTGAREAMLMPEIMQTAIDAADEPKPTMREWIESHWARDPYDAEQKGPLTMNLAEAKQYDERFPNHPLSRLRRMMELVEDRLRISDEVKEQSPFRYPAEDRPPNASSSKAWWKWWGASSVLALA